MSKSWDIRFWGDVDTRMDMIRARELDYLGEDAPSWYLAAVDRCSNVDKISDARRRLTDMLREAESCGDAVRAGVARRHLEELDVAGRSRSL